MAIIETKNATTTPVTSVRTSAGVNVKPNFTSFSRLAPNITGIARKKVNSAATHQELPTTKPPKILQPERDVPGITDNT